MDRNEILPGTVLAAFGETVATGLLVIGVVGLFVGAEILTAGQATWLLVGAAGYSGITAYNARRDEIEQSNYDVSVPESMLDAAGDALGVSQLIEGITGQRLGTDMPMGSQARSSQLGAGTGNAATLYFGSRAFRKGQGIGRSALPARAGLKPAGPDAHVPTRPAAPMPDAPAPNPGMGPAETAARAALPENLRGGLDLWSAEIRQNKGNPEVVLNRVTPERVRLQAEVFIERHQAAVAEAQAGARRAARAGDDPLRPQLRNVVPVEGSRVTLHYESTRPAQHEVLQAIEIARRTGEQVQLFGDTASGINYPGIDGTIGSPPRPLSLKSAVAQAHPNLARKMAGDALQRAREAGYTQVEVHIEIPGRTRAEIQAAWDAPPPLASDPLPGPAFEGTVIAKVVIRAADGIWTLTPPLKGPALTGVSPTPARPEVEKVP